MTDTQLLLGSLSNDLFRVAALQQRGSHTAARRFLDEAKRWSIPLSQAKLKKYITQIAKEISEEDSEIITSDQAEKYLMYGVLLQNVVSLQLRKSSIKVEVE